MLSGAALFRLRLRTTRLLLFLLLLLLRTRTRWTEDLRELRTAAATIRLFE